MASCAQRLESGSEAAGGLCAPNVPTTSLINRDTSREHTIAPIPSEMKPMVAILRDLAALAYG
jgi:hypothetical protein